MVVEKSLGLPFLLNSISKIDSQTHTQQTHTIHGQRQWRRSQDY